MRPLLHLLSIALLLPSLVFAMGFALLGHAIAGATLFQFLYRLLMQFLAVMTWGIFAAAGFFILLVLGGFFVQTRWLAGLCVAILSVVSAAVLIVLGSGPFDAGQWLFLVPGAASLFIGAWLAYTEWP